MKYPKESKKLLSLVAKDQKSLAGLNNMLKSVEDFAEKITHIKQTAKQCQKNAAVMLQILNKIEVPTISNVGREGSNAIILLSLHSNIRIMKHVIQTYKNAPFEDIPHDYLPVLFDRISIIENRKQIFGTIKYDSLDGKEYFAPLIDKKLLSQNRTKYGLDKLTILQKDIKEMTEKEFMLNFAFMDQDLL